ncbi:MAG: CxxxxCH/CxxCH domain-containing protein [Ignavibacteria bacterium]|nr:CxxxxCH/CxxCH domain-containing protein [Ignavibacteria bacterium]
MYKLKYLFVFILIALFGFLLSCSDIYDDLPIAPQNGQHPDGWSIKSSADFHGSYIYSKKLWNLSACITCHGKDYNGGISGVSCYKCHLASPEDCRLCHGNGINTIYPPKALNGDTSVLSRGVGTHDTHINPNYSKSTGCITCHRTPASFEDSIHIGTHPDGIAEVIFDSTAVITTGGIKPNPVWNRNNLNCDGSYCHGNFVNGNYRLLSPPINPIWSSPSSVNCGSCHGNPQTNNPLPAGTHPQGYTINNCYFCHGSVINSQGIIINKNLHLNGIINWN